MLLRKTILATVICVLFSAIAAVADDWPTCRHDVGRTGVTDHDLDVEHLRMLWVWKSPYLPQPAWAGPAKRDAYRRLTKLPAMRDYDFVFQPIAVAGSVYFGSSAENAVYCLDAATGDVRWTFIAEGPVRVAPTYDNGRVFFGADDGSAYCLDADDGALKWQFRPFEDPMQVFHNGRLISPWPCRTGVAVVDGTAYFGCSMLPWCESFVCAVDAETGQPEGDGRYVKKLNGATLEGSLAVSTNHLFFSQGRVAPRRFNRADGADQGQLKGGGGSLVVLTRNDQVVHGPGAESRKGAIAISNLESKAAVANYPQGIRAVVRGSVAYVLNGEGLIATDILNKKIVWQTNLSNALNLILVGDTIFVGGLDRVSAHRATDGEEVWQHRVGGRAYGLIAANGRLLVSTDTGAMYTFAPSATSPPTDEPPETAVDLPASQAPLNEITPVTDKSLVGRWVFQEPHVDDDIAKDLTGNQNAAIQGKPQVVRIGNQQAVALDGKTSGIVVSNKLAEAHLPKQDIAVAAWVRVDQVQRWGGLVGAIQDNGSYERGWLLGFENTRFNFALASKGGPGSLTYMQAAADFTPGNWYHVVGTYDGETMNLYVNGQLAATSKQQNGEINYPPDSFYEIGAYHDSNELYRTRGMIHEVRVYNRALSSKEAASQFAEKSKHLPIGGESGGQFDPLVGTWAQITKPGEAIIRWHTEQPSPSTVDLSLAGETKTIRDPEPKTEHSLVIDNLRHNRIYQYAIRAEFDEEEVRSREHELDTFFDYNLDNLPGHVAPTGQLPGKFLSDLAGSEGGICLVFGCHNLDLARQILFYGRHRVIVLEFDKKQIAKARADLKSMQLYGPRISITQVASFDDLPVPPKSVDMIVARASVGDRCPKPPTVSQLLRPGGGAIVGRPGNNIDSVEKTMVTSWLRDAPNGKLIEPPRRGIWAVIRGQDIPDGGEWSHQYGRADNSAFGGETLGGARKTSDLELQWIGRPGPRYQSDRGNRKPSPLSTNGRLFVQGWHRIIALSAYNGHVLWSLETPTIERFNMPHDCSNWCADDDHVFAAVQNRCWRIDAATGKVSAQFPVVEDERRDWEFDWGYIASEESAVIGTAVKKGSAWTNIYGGASEGWYDAVTGPVTHPLCSENVFSINKKSGKTNWNHQAGLILHSTITIGEGHIYFIESRNAKAIASESRRVGEPELWQDQYLVALDARTGRKLYEQPVDTADGTAVFYLAHSSGRLVLVSSTEGKFHIYGFDAANGKQVWYEAQPWTANHHGKHYSRPALVGGMVYVRPHILDLATGQVQSDKMPAGGCGTYACTSDTLIFRNRTVTMWDRQGSGATDWQRLRPDCWISTIPAGGMLLSPEGGGGCSCGSWIESSMGFGVQRD